MSTQDVFTTRPADVARLERQARAMQAEFFARTMTALRTRIARFLHSGAAAPAVKS